MTRPRRELDEVLAQDVVNFLKKSWKLAMGTMDSKQQAWAASSGQQEIAQFTDIWIKNFMKVMGQVYRPDATDPSDQNLTPQNRVWKKLEWRRLYKFLKKIAPRSAPDVALTSPAEFNRVIKNPILGRVLQSMKYTPIPLTMQILNSTEVISPKPYKKGKVFSGDRYASQDIALGLIGLVCEEVAAKFYNVGIDDDGDDGADDTFKDKLDTQVIEWTRLLGQNLDNAAKIELAQDFLDFIKDNASDIKSSDKIQQDISSRATVKKILDLELDDAEPEDKNKFDQVMAQIKQSDVLILNEQQYRFATRLLEAIDVSWNDLGFKADLTESHNGIIVMRPF